MLYEYFSLISHLIEELQTFADQIQAVYLSGDLAVQCVESDTKVELLIILKESNSTIETEILKYQSEKVEIILTTTAEFTITSYYGLIKFQKNKLLMGQELNLPEPEKTDETKELIGKLEENIHLLNSTDTREERMPKLLGEMLEILYYLEEGIFLTKFKEYLYNDYYKDPQDFKKEIYEKIIDGNLNFSMTHLGQLSHDLSTKIKKLG